MHELQLRLLALPLFAIAIFQTGNVAANRYSFTQSQSSPATRGPDSVSLHTSQPSSATRPSIFIPGSTSVLTYHNDQARTGSNLTETSLTTANVNHVQFGKKYSFPVDGQIYAQPLYVPNLTVHGKQRNVVFVATQNDSVYAFDADGVVKTPLWSKKLGTAHSSREQNGIWPRVGITSTPVIDSVSQTIYVVSAGVETSRNVFRLHALDLSTGVEKFGGPVLITAKVSGTGRGSVNGQIRLPGGCYQRSGLALDSTNVYIGFGHCAHGWLLAYDKNTLRQTAVFNSTPDGAGGQIWMSGGAPAFDPTGDLYVITAVDAGDPASGYNDSVLRLSQALSVQDFFTPSNEAVLRTNDADFGSGGVIVLPDDPASKFKVAVAGGKDGRIFILNRDNLGKFQSSDHVLQIVKTGVKQYDNIFATPAYWNGHLFYHCENDVAKTYSWVNGRLSQSPTSQGRKKYGIHGATPSLSANGSINAIVWEIETTRAPTGGPAILHAYDALDLSHELYNSSQVSRDQAGPAVKFSVPTVADGKVFVGSGTRLDVFGLL